uniref:Photosystem I reaction center subunit psaKic n=1 Tax=Rhizophora mucronata TaxID=61149 RepID=A0A2P2KRH7_RHIMU
MPESQLCITMSCSIRVKFHVLFCFCMAGQNLNMSTKLSNLCWKFLNKHFRLRAPDGNKFTAFSIANSLVKIYKFSIGFGLFLTEKFYGKQILVVFNDIDDP